MKVKIICDQANQELEEMFINNQIIESVSYKVVKGNGCGDIVIEGEKGVWYDIYEGEYEVVE